MKQFIPYFSFDYLAHTDTKYEQVSSHSDTRPGMARTLEEVDKILNRFPEPPGAEEMESGLEGDRAKLDTPELELKS